MMADYGYQLEIKKGFVKDALLRLGGITANVDIVGADTPFRYRNKMVFPFGKDGVWGFYREHSHDVVPLSDCLLGDKINKDILNTIAKYMKKFGVLAYDEESHSGIIRRVFIRNTDTEFLVVISANADSLPYSDESILLP